MPFHEALTLEGRGCMLTYSISDRLQSKSVQIPQIRLITHNNEGRREGERGGRGEVFITGDLTNLILKGI
jgi:hypothetical protein